MSEILTIETLTSKSFSEILESISESIHNKWMVGRIAEGWKLGPKRNDEKKEHPSLIPYEELSENEKEYDRRTVIASMSYLIENGYEIQKKEQ